MTLLQRRLFVRSMRTGSLIILLLQVLSVLLAMAMESGDGGSVSPVGPAFLRHQVVAFEASLALGLPLGTLVTVLELKSSGILTPFFAAGAPATCLRRPLLVLASVATLLSAAAVEAEALLSAGPGSPVAGGIWRDADLVFWSPRGPRGADRKREVYVFRESDLDVSVAEVLDWDPRGSRVSLGNIRALAGGPIAVSGFTPRPPVTDLLAPTSLLAAGGGTGRSAALFSTLSRILFTPALLLLAASLALLLPVRGQAAAYLGMLLLPCVLGTALLWSGLLLWSGGPGGGAAAAGTVLAVLGAMAEVFPSAR